ncbi:MAG: ABC transporter substrate-binding protein [Pseudomonadota bacterium]
MKRKKFSMLCGVILIAVILIASPFMVAFANAAPPKAKTLKIGAIISMTGFASASEMLIWEGVQLFEQWINEQGGITIKGQPYLIKFIAEDGQSSADGAVAAATKLVYDHGVKFLVGPVMPFMVVASGSVTEPAKVIRVALYNCYMPAEYGPKTPYTFIANDTTVDFMTPNMQYLKEAYPKAKTIAVLTPDDGAPPYLEPLFREKAKAEGLELLGFVLWSLDTQDFTPVTVKALATKPDSLFLINGWPIHMGSMLKAAREMGFTGPVLACHEDPYDIREVAGRQASTDFYTHNIAIDSPEMTPMIKEIAKRGKAKYGRTSPTHVWGWSPSWSVVQAIEAAQSLDPTVVKDSWEKMASIQTPYGTGKMGGKKTYGINHTVSAPMPLAGLKGGEVIWVKWQEVPMP